MSNYQPDPAKPGVYRCTKCGHGVRTNAPETIHGCRCAFPVRDELLERAGILTPCVHLGEPTGEVVAGCGCTVPAWQKEYHGCAVHGSCVLLELSKRPGVRNCETCLDDPARKISP